MLISFRHSRESGNPCPLPLFIELLPDKCLDIIERVQTNRKHYRLVEQLESAATSPALNIAEGKGRFSKKEFVYFLYIARGSLFETVTLLVIFRRRGWIKDIEWEHYQFVKAYPRGNGDLG